MHSAEPFRGSSEGCTVSVENVTKAVPARLSDDGTAVVCIDQTLLPNETVYLTLSSAEDLWEAIYMLRVRGAPTIGVFAAYAIYVLSLQTKETAFGAFYEEFRKNKDYLDSSRPTAVNLKKQLDRMERCVLAHREEPVEKILPALKQEALDIHREELDMLAAVSEYGLTLVKDGDGILTHCNAGPLAMSPGLGSILLGKERGYEFHCWVDETRPLLQGARLTSYELTLAGVDCTLICDNMASIVMKEGKVNACFVGCDRVAANGDTANKIGTSGVAILAKHYGIPFYVFCPSSTIDFNCATGADIRIEQRRPEEIKTKFYEKPMALDSVKCYNPAFDVTDGELITAIVTERGICRAPYTESLKALFGGDER